MRSNLSTNKFTLDKCRIQLFLVNLDSIINQHDSLLSGLSCHLIKEQLCHFQSNCNDILSNIYGLYGADSEMYCWPLYASVCTASYAACINTYHYLNKHDISFFSRLACEGCSKAAWHAQPWFALPVHGIETAFPPFRKYQGVPDSESGFNHTISLGLICHFHLLGISLFGGL